MRIGVLLAAFLVVSGGLILIGSVILAFLAELEYARPLAAFLLVLGGLASIAFVILAFVAELKNGRLSARSRRRQKKRLKRVLSQLPLGALFGAIWGAIFFNPLFGGSAIICEALIGALVASVYTHVVGSE